MSALEIEEGKAEAIVPFTSDAEAGENQDGIVTADGGRTVGMRGVWFSALIMIMFWALCITLRMVMETIDYTRIKCGIAEVYANNPDALQDCVRHTAIFRVATVLMAILVGQMILCVCLDKESAVKYWDGYWLVKLVSFVAISFGLLYPGGITFFDDQVFAWIARFGGFLYIIFQSIVFLDWAYQFNESCVTKALESSGGSGAARSMQRTFDGITGNAVKGAVSPATRFVCLIAFAAVNLSGFAVAMGYLYKYYGNEGCSENVWIITVSILLVVLAAITQLDGKRGKGSITTTGVLSLYVAYTTYSAVALNPVAECNASMTHSSIYGIGPVVLGTIFSFLSVLYITIIAARKIATIIVAGPIPLTGLLGVLAGYKSSADYGTTGTNLDLTNLKTLVVNLCFVQICICCYISCITTNWGTIVAGWSSVGGATDAVAALATSVGSSNASMYMMAIGGWLAVVLYILALCVPTLGDCFPTSIWQLQMKST